MDTTLKSVQLFTHPTGIQLTPYSFGVFVRVASPAIQGIVATRGMTLAFGYTVVCACSGSCASFKKLICPLMIFRLESTIDGEIWRLKSSHSEFTRSPVKTYVLVPRSLL
jgi:hypothetical protein